MTESSAGKSEYFWESHNKMRRAVPTCLLSGRKNTPTEARSGRGVLV
jgi:hypothetical protein